MAQDKAGMARSWTVRFAAALLVFGLASDTRGFDESPVHRMLEPPSRNSSSVTGRPSAEERALVDFALDRFRAQNLVPPRVDFHFHDTLMPCDGHKGLYHSKANLIEMCALDTQTILHELGHAWAKENLSGAQMDRFVAERNLDSWNDHSHEWERRGTEHVAETIAWALLEEPKHVKWVETQDVGSSEITYVILTLHIDVETLVDNFKQITGMEPAFRHPAEWPQTDPAPETSPELVRVKG